jgi:hypothetical protein
MIYSDIPYQIHRLEHDPSYEIIAEIYKEDGRLIAALFKEVTAT